MCSDGLAVKDGKVWATDVRKVHRVSASVGFCWLGAWHPELEKKLLREITGLASVGEAAIRVGEVLKHTFSNQMQHLEKLPIWMLFVGYENEKLHGAMIYTSVTDIKPFEPFEQPVFPGLIGAKAYNAADESAEKVFYSLLTKKYLPLYQDAEYATRTAFMEMLETEEHCGGQIFIETLTK